MAYDGSILRGRERIEDTHRWLFDGPLRHSRLGDDAPSVPDPIEFVRFIRPDVAVILIHGGVREETQNFVTAERASIISLVLVVDGERWLIVGFQNTRQQSQS